MPFFCSRIHSEYHIYILESHPVAFKAKFTETLDILIRGSMREGPKTYISNKFPKVTDGVNLPMYFK